MYNKSDIISVINIFRYTDSMVGDVNLFFNDDDDIHAAEIEIMIAGGCT